MKEGAVSLDNFVEVEIHGGGTVGLDCLVEASSHLGLYVLEKGSYPIECSINCISLFSVIFLHLWTHI